MYCLEDSSGDKHGQPDILMQFSAKESRATLAIYDVAQNFHFEMINGCIALLYTALKKKRKLQSS